MQPPSLAGKTRSLPKQGWAHGKIPHGSRVDVVHGNSPETTTISSDDPPSIQHEASSKPTILQNGSDTGDSVRMRYRRAVALGFEALDLIAAEGARERQMQDERNSRGRLQLPQWKHPPVEIFARHVSLQMCRSACTRAFVHT